MAHPLSYNRQKPLFIPPKRRLSLGKAEQALDDAYATGTRVLIYIHGRAVKTGEPRKSVEQGIYKNLGNYGLSVIGFTWDADDRGYDETRPIASADDFDQFLDILNGFLSSDTSRPKPSLLAHSMGNLIISELAKDDRLTRNRGQRFENIVFSAPAVKRKRHHFWLGRIGVSQRNYVMVNPNDKILLGAGFGFKPNMLGRELKPPGAAPDQAVYINLNELSVNHRYFTKPRQKNLRKFFSQALTGQAVDFESIADADAIEGVPVQTIKGTF